MAGTEGEVWGHGLCWSLTVFWWLIYTKQQSQEHLHTPNIRFTLSLLSCSHFTALSTKQSTYFGSFTGEWGEVKEQTSQRARRSLPGEIVPSLTSETPTCYFCCMHRMSLGSVKQGPSSWQCVHYIWDLRQFHFLFLGMIFLEIYKTYRMG